VRLLLVKNGKKHSGFFGIFITDSKDTEILRLRRWLNDFSGTPKNYTIIFTTPQSAKNVYVGYRINKKTPTRSDFEISLPDDSTLKLEEVANNVDDQYDDKNAFVSRVRQLDSAEKYILEKNMTWIFGSPRSGTTWLSKLMSDNPDNIIWNEPYLGVHLNVEKQHEARGDYVFSEFYKKNWLPDLRKFILSCTYSHCRKIDKKIIIKEPNGSYGAPLLLECLPNSKIIFLIRDGRDVVDSLIDAHNPDSWNDKYSDIPLANQRIRNEQIDDHSKIWKHITVNVLDAYNKHNPNLRYKLKYEDLRNNTFEELKKCYEFIGDSINDKDLNDIIDRYDFNKIPKSEKGSGKFYRFASPGLWKKHFSEDEQKLMNTIMGKTLSKFDYEV